MAGRPRIPFFTDNNVPDSVGNALYSAGHEVKRLRDCMARDSADQIVAIACAIHGYVLVTHDKDFRAIAKRLGITQRQYQKLHRVSLRCKEVNSTARITGALSLIEREWDYARKAGDWQMQIEISEVSIRTVR